MVLGTWPAYFTFHSSNTEGDDVGNEKIQNNSEKKTIFSIIVLVIQSDVFVCFLINMINVNNGDE